MYKSSFFTIFATIALIAAFGCSGSGNPVLPDNENYLQLTEDATQTDFAVLWGYFDVYLDESNGTLEAVPNRSTMFAANVTGILNNNPTTLGFAFNGFSSGSGYLDVDVDLTIKHPLALTGYQGYDVRAIFIGNGSATMSHKASLRYPVNGTDQYVSNADGYTRWFNPLEFFVSGLFGYTKGIYASNNYTATATLNPYKYYAEGLSANGSLWDHLSTGNAEAGTFLNGTSNTRNFQIRFKLPNPGVKYGYAILANWKGAKPEFHPSHAIEAQAVKIDITPEAYYVDDQTNGGDIILDISIFDWASKLTGGVMEDYDIIIESTAMSTHYILNSAERTPTFSGKYFKYHVVIPADNLHSAEGNEVWVCVRYNNSSYSGGAPNATGTDKITACFRFPLPILNEIQPDGSIILVQPNGGESWLIGKTYQIIWSAEVVPSTLTIIYSSDDFNTSKTLITGAPNTGTWDWKIFGIDPTTTAKIRIQADNKPDISFDVSDNYFEIHN